MENSEITSIIENNPDVKKLCKLIGKRFVLDGFSSQETLVIAVYLYENHLKATMSEDDLDLMYEDILSIYEHLGGNVSNYNHVCTNASSYGWINYKYAPDELKIPYLSSENGVKKLEELLGKYSDLERRVIRSGEFYTAEKKFKEFLQSDVLPSSDLWLVDPYISKETFDFFKSIFDKVNKFEILTKTIYEESEGALRSNIDKFEKEGKLSVEIRKNDKLHDRIITSEKGCWTVGYSIKDLGKKDSIFSDVTLIKTTIDELIAERWKEGKIFYPLQK